MAGLQQPASRPDCYLQSDTHTHSLVCKPLEAKIRRLTLTGIIWDIWEIGVHRQVLEMIINCFFHQSTNILKTEGFINISLLRKLENFELWSDFDWYIVSLQSWHKIKTNSDMRKSWMNNIQLSKMSKAGLDELVKPITWQCFDIKSWREGKYVFSSRNVGDTLVNYLDTESWCILIILQRICAKKDCTIMLVPVFKLLQKGDMLCY